MEETKDVVVLRIEAYNAVAGTNYRSEARAERAYWKAILAGAGNGGGTLPEDWPFDPQELLDRVERLEARMQYLEDNIFDIINGGGGGK